MDFAVGGVEGEFLLGLEGWGYCEQENGGVASEAMKHEAGLLRSGRVFRRGRRAG